MARVRGALNRHEWKILRHAYPETPVYFVSRYRIDKKQARYWAFGGGGASRYFTNYFHAYAYAVKLGTKDLTHWSRHD